VVVRNGYGGRNQGRMVDALARDIVRFIPPSPRLSLI
jgi:hypothetical protein